MQNVRVHFFKIHNVYLHFQKFKSVFHSNLKLLKGKRVKMRGPLLHSGYLKGTPSKDIIAFPLVTLPVSYPPANSGLGASSQPWQENLEKISKGRKGYCLANTNPMPKENTPHAFLILNASHGSLSLSRYSNISHINGC